MLCVSIFTFAWTCALLGCITSDASGVVPSGLQRGMPAVYTDLGPASPGQRLRALVALPIRDPDGLAATIASIYDPSSPEFRNYLSADEWIARHAPSESDVVLVQSWLESWGLAVPRVARNRLLLEITGTVADFDRAFQTELHLFERNDASGHDAQDQTFGTLTDLYAPGSVAEHIASVVVADLPAADTPLSHETGDVHDNPPPDGTSLSLAQVAHAYGIDHLNDVGGGGQGVSIGLVVGGTFRYVDVQSFWQAQGISRADPEVVETMEPPATRSRETTLDLEWAGGLAPAAELIVYQGPDAHDTSLVYAFNEAIGDGRVQVLSDSFVQRESAQPRAIHMAYDASARMAAALGITVVAASGDAGQPAVPSSSPFVTAVGGTRLVVDAQGLVSSEEAWQLSGCGDALSFDAPDWQAGLAPGAGRRAVSDVALNAGSSYWTYLSGSWKADTGTSFTSPAFAALIAVVDSAREQAGKPAVGFLNSLLYRDAQVQQAFRDVVSGGTPEHAAGPGWDYPTGWGAPDAAALAEALP